jgi:hypothetical protein
VEKLPVIDDWPDEVPITEKRSKHNTSRRNW